MEYKDEVQKSVIFEHMYSVTLQPWLSCALPAAFGFVSLFDANKVYLKKVQPDRFSIFFKLHWNGRLGVNAGVRSRVGSR